MTFVRVASLAGMAVLVMIVNVAISFLYVAVYGYVINPGHDKQYYSEYAQVAAPYCSIIAGIPLMFLAGWWVAGWWNGQYAVAAALVIWVTYLLIDVMALVAAGVTRKMAALVAVSMLTKLAAVYLGAKLRSGQL